MCDAECHGAVVGDEVGCQVDRPVEDERGRFSGELEQVPRHIGHIAHIALQSCVAVDEAYHGLRIGSFFDFVDACHGLRIGGVASDSPHRVGGIEDYPTLFQHLYGVANIFVVNTHAE